MNGGTYDYKFGQKNNWRRWAWNRIVERIHKPARDAVVIYLAGKDDYDRGIAIDRGFRNENLIAVERDKNARHQIRKSGALCVDGDFYDTLYSWPEHTPIDVVFGDFCSGYDLKIAAKLHGLFTRPSLNGAVFAFNMLRGREPNLLFKDVEQIGTKHRGLRLLYVLVQMCLEQHKKATGSYPDLERRIEFAERLAEISMPIDGSYMSQSRQVFDSIILRNFVPKDCISNGWDPSSAGVANITTKVAAILAHRTMRITN